MPGGVPWVGESVPLLLVRLAETSNSLMESDELKRRAISSVKRDQLGVHTANSVEYNIYCLGYWALRSERRKGKDLTLCADEKAKDWYSVAYFHSETCK